MLHAGRTASVLLASAATLSACGPARIGSDSRRDEPPNIIVIVADDLGWADLGYRGSIVETPNIDRLAATGVRFESFYAHPWCSPTRSSLLTGRFPPAYVWDIANADVAEYEGIDAQEYTLPERFRDAGYATALIGKWHLGTGWRSHPNRHGFDSFYGFLGGYIGYYIKSSFLGLNDWQRNGVQIFGEPQYTTTLLGLDAAKYVRERDVSKPFFLMLGFNAPHFPQEAPEETIEKYVTTSSCRSVRNRCKYLAQVDVMDQEIGRLLQTLKDEAIEADTLVVFFSDNGGSAAFGGSNTPLRGGKSGTYEGGIRVPAILNWPGVLAEGEVSHQRMQVADLYATLESAAGLPSRAPRESFDGWRAIVAGEALPREPMFFMNARSAGGRFESRSRSLLDGEWKLVVVDAEAAAGGSTAELFRIESDPSELHDVAMEFPQQVSRLRQLMDASDAMLRTEPVQ